MNLFRRATSIAAIALCTVPLLPVSSFAASLQASPATSPATATDQRTEILKTREAVWRAWFANDTKVLNELVPPETSVISAGEQNWKTQADIFQSAAQFHQAGGKLISLEFPRTEIQRFGDVAVIYTQYRLETEVDGKRSPSSGRATEIFVFRHGKWTNPGWHTDAEKSQ